MYVKNQGDYAVRKRSKINLGIKNKENKEILREWGGMRHALRVSDRDIEKFSTCQTKKRQVNIVLKKFIVLAIVHFGAKESCDEVDFSSYF